MNKRALKADLLLLLTAGIWGFGFVAQRSGMEYIGPFAFNGIRFLLGSLSLLPLIFWIRRGERRDKRRKNNTAANSVANTIAASCIAGTILFFAVILQQFGLMFTTEGKAGFITGFYVVLTPIAGIFLGKKTGAPTWVGMIFSLAGLYFISLFGHLDSINPGDALMIVSALFWTAHVLAIDHLVQKTDPLVLSAGQFAVCGIFTLAGAFLAESFISQWIGDSQWVKTLSLEIISSGRFGWIPFPAMIRGLTGGGIPFAQVSGALIPILYGGLGSVGIAYTLQVVAQKDAPPAHATIILCLEGSFAALGGVLISDNILEWTTVMGFALMLAGMLVSQWEVIAGGGLRKQNGC
jgi:drug/metabolite transporter (DMT)-like permease